ncbi:MULTISPECIES: hypothetical protein [Citrobacter]
MVYSAALRFDIALFH